MVTNRKIPSGRLVLIIDKAKEDEDLKTCVKTIRNTGLKHKGKIEKLINSVLAFSDTEIEALIKRIKVFDSSSSSDSMFKDGIKRNMKISDEIPFNNIYQQYLGWVFEKTVLSWNSNKEAWLDADSFITLSNRLIAQYSSRPFIERTIENLPVSQKSITKHRTKNFVRQLETIQIDEEDTIIAINDYLRASSEKTRFAKESIITLQDWKVFENNLLDRWNNIFKPICRNAVGLSELDKGYQIYYKTLQHKEKLCGVETEQNYTTKGAYHRLANKILLGWHPQWKKLFTKTK